MQDVRNICSCTKIDAVPPVINDPFAARAWQTSWSFRKVTLAISAKLKPLGIP